MQKSYKWVSLLTTIGMGLVLLMGALVTKTESGRGCGDDWPLCNGKFIPAYTIESMIEYSHRAVSGLVGILVLAAAIYTYKLLRHSGEAKLFAYSALFFTVLQAILGAMAVVWPTSDAVLALHFGFSLVAFAATLLLTIGVWKDEFSGDKTVGKLGTVSRKFRNTVWLVTGYSYVVVYIGAFVRHTESSGGCLGWPLCNGEVVPELSGATGIAFAHRIAAAILFLAIAYIAFRANRTYADIPFIRTSARWALTLAGLQVISGALIVYALGTDWYLFAALLHVILIACLFGILCDLCVRVRRMAAG
ncbi:COX15/CtaA family protein [Paenibacillus sp. HJGM_3]|uniref:COX15/CtaA family protein n=1 Tax=Paenibacillus sp. HJGM_3 TaxID=3379816 RepID=UPI003858B9D1